MFFNHCFPRFQLQPNGLLLSHDFLRREIANSAIFGTAMCYDIYIVDKNPLCFLSAKRVLFIKQGMEVLAINIDVFLGHGRGTMPLKRSSWSNYQKALPHGKSLGTSLAIYWY